MYRCSILTLLLVFGAAGSAVGQKDPKQTPQNTLTLTLPEPVRMQSFPKPLKFYVANTTDRSGNPQPILVWRPRGGIYLDREPKLVVKEALEQCLKAADAMAPDAASADLIMEIYVFHFGLGEGSGMEFYGKVDLNIVVTNPQTKKSEQVTALGTSIQNRAVRKKNILTNVQENLQGALYEALRNLLRGTRLRDAVNLLTAG